ncbi:hypothetical protein CAAN1_01S12904 [[Candida] anglica]|uniref:Protein YTP1-like C-terminal domain-containing protein n=1 Tax=[Candida] anglica TaxID=148631 RepID=A0ABP0EP12_9ASCO
MKFKSLYIVFLSLTLALAAESTRDEHHLHNESGMELGSDMDMSDTKPSDNDVSSVSSADVSPTPHVSHHHHGVPILETNLLPAERAYWEAYNTTTFLTSGQGNKTSLYTHILSLLTAVIFIYPLVMVAKNVGSKRFHIPLFTLYSILIIIAILSLSIYGRNAPDLYPGNAYYKMTWILTFTTIIQIFSTVLYYLKFSSSKNSISYGRINDDEEMQQLASASSESPLSNGSSSDWEHSDRLELNRIMEEKANNSSSSIFNKFTSNRYIMMILAKLEILNNWLGVSNLIIFNLLNWGHFFFFLAYIPTGVATVLVLGKGDTVFNLLAHFIKGGVFFSLGMLSLARYCGAFEGLGWAWNCRYDSNTNSTKLLPFVSMEMVESSLILFYGCTNVFLEHLANPGGEWSAKDLQHASIAFIYIGAGLCGVITELKLKSWKQEKSLEKLSIAIKNDDSQNNHPPANLATKFIQCSPGFSPNPFPIFTIFWTGILMSQHAQASELSTAIHVQWGNLLVYGTVFRFITYILMTFLPISYKLLTKPSKPLTEIITSFCLLCGGFVFMESTDPVVLGLEYRGFTAMFTLNVSLGIIALFMAWEMSVFAFKDWLKKRV